MVDYIKEKESSQLNVNSNSILNVFSSTENQCDEETEILITKEKRGRGRKPLSDKMKEAIAYDNKELERKKDILISCSIIGELEQYVGEKFSAVQLRKMKKEKLETVFNLYHQKAGFEKANNAIGTFVDMSVKGFSYVGSIEKEEEFKKDLRDDVVLKKMIAIPIISFTEKFGDVVGFFNLSHTIWKHVSFNFMKREVPLKESANCESANCESANCEELIVD